VEAKEKEEMDKWLKESVELNAPKMEASAMFVGLATKNYMKDPLCALQLGLAILMDKPIVIIADKGEKIPEALVKIAKVIERVNMEDQADIKRAMGTIGKFAETLP
jgi:hypothetical protein